jgi:hypothetical protein
VTKREYVFLSRDGMYYTFREFDKLDKDFYVSLYRDHKLKDICGFVYMKGNKVMKRKYPIMNLCEGMK